MGRPLDSIDPVAREQFKSIKRQLNALRTSTTTELTSVLSAVGGVRTGAPSDRGMATDRFPEIFIQVDISNALVTGFVTIPTDTLGGSYDWATLFKFTLT